MDKIKIVSYIIVIIITIIFLFPLAWLFLTSFKSSADQLIVPPKLIFTPTLTNFIRSLTAGSGQIVFAPSEQTTGTTIMPASVALFNSILVSLSSTALSLCLGVPAAYGLSRFRIKRGSDISFYILAQRMAPPIAIIVPFFAIMRFANLLTTYPAIILAHMTFNLPFTVWLMKGFFDEIPLDLDESGLIDGCTAFGAFRLILPLTAPGLVATTILCILFSWNEFLFATVLSGPSTQTITVMMTSFYTSYTIDWGALAATVSISIIPMLILALLFQKYLVRGLTFGAVKG